MKVALRLWAHLDSKLFQRKVYLSFKTHRILNISYRCHTPCSHLFAPLNDDRAMIHASASVCAVAANEVDGNDESVDDNSF